MGTSELVRVVSLQSVGRSDVGRVGGKNASLGELLRALTPQGIRVPPGFATTAAAYWEFVDHNGLRPVISEALHELKSGSTWLDEMMTAVFAGHEPDDRRLRARRVQV